MKTQLLKGDNLELLPTLADNSIDAIVTDPPYELGFMGKSWDSSGIAYKVALWAECLRVLKPGGHLIAFGGSRTYHRLACAVEDAGFEIRDQLMWVYGSGFPKSLNLKDDWQGWGTALKPSHEPMVLARKPLGEKTVAENVLRWGTGALNIDGCRVGESQVGNDYSSKTVMGRWPANFIHDGSDEVLELFPETKPATESAARFFYCAKASKAERNAGLDALPIKRPDTRTQSGMGTFDEKGVQPQRNFHPTVKPIALMRYLIRLVTPPNGTVLDPFAGSGTTLVAAIQEKVNSIGIELTEDYWPIIEGRTQHALCTRCE